MKRARESKRVSWAAGANLCQVKKISSEDCSSKVGQKSLAHHHHHQTKTSLILNSSVNESSDDIPPGFEGKHFLNQSKVEFSLAPQIKWECPPQFIFDPSKVFLAAGEESWEKMNEELRELTVLESFYPRISTIPPSPSVSLYVEKEHYDDKATPLIPHEEQEECVDDPETATTTVSSSSLSTTVAVPTSGLKNIVPSVPFSTPPTDAATTISSTTGLLSSSGLRPAILPLSLPKPTHDEGESTMSVPIFPFSRPMSGPATQTMSFLPAPMAPHMQRAVQNILRSNATPHALNLQPPQKNTVQSYGVNGVSSLPSIVSNKSNLVPLPSAIVNMNAPLNLLHPTASIAPYQLNNGSAFAVRDANYYKDLIRQYGIDKQNMLQGSQIRINHTSFQDLSQVHNKQGEVKVKQKIQKPCKYFKSSSGCRNGSNCTYLHNMSAQGEGHNAKIIRL